MSYHIKNVVGEGWAKWLRWAKSLQIRYFETVLIARLEIIQDFRVFERADV